jgi:hypothetical protein
MCVVTGVSSFGTTTPFAVSELLLISGVSDKKKKV